MAKKDDKDFYSNFGTSFDKPSEKQERQTHAQRIGRDEAGLKAGAEADTSIAKRYSGMRQVGLHATEPKRDSGASPMSALEQLRHQAEQEYAAKHMNDEPPAAVAQQKSSLERLNRMREEQGWAASVDQPSPGGSKRR